MTLIATDISKSYGSQVVLNDLSINLRKGEIVGLLGRNGVGKSTLLKIIANINLPDSGTLVLEGGNVGFLSERNPIYPFMYVREYLSWIGSIKEVASIKERVDWAISAVGLKEVLGKKVDQLSKGYKQRLGLAATLLPDPDLIILDEPISGLDPIQIDEYRSLIRDLGRNKTILLSSHILSEIEAICDRVLLLKDGQIQEEKMITRTDQQVFHLSLNDDIKANQLLQIDGVEEVKMIGRHSYLLYCSNEKEIRSEIFDCVVSAQLKILEFSSYKSTVNEMFK